MFEFVKMLTTCLTVVMFCLSGATNCAKGTALDDANLLSNGSFEQYRPGTTSMTADWNIRPWARGDRGELITDAQRAHSGLRYMRICSPDGEGIRLDAVPNNKGIALVPGTTYEISLWARTEPGVSGAKLIVEPGHYRAILTSEWRRYSVTYQHPANAKDLLGLYISVNGGPVAIDDVAMVPKGCEVVWPDELKADRKTLKPVPTSWEWRFVQDEPKWTKRVPVSVSEVMGTEARNHLVRLKVADLFNALTYEGLSPKRIVVVDASLAGNKKVPFALVDTHLRIKGISPQDEVCFLVNVPAKSRKTYFVYFAQDRKQPTDETLPTELPRKLAIPSDYPHQLDVEIGPPQKQIDINCGMIDGRLKGDICAFSANSVTAEIVSPDEQTTLSLPLKKTETKAYLWLIDDSFAMPDDFEKGIWQIKICAESIQDKNECADAAFVAGSAMWTLPLIEKILPLDPPQYGRDIARPAAAQNQAESFQIFIETNTDLRNVTLSIDDLTRRDKRATIPAPNVDFKFVDMIYFPIAEFENGGGLFSGLYPDPLLPWRSRDIKAGQRAFALVTITVPANAAPGEYWATLTASSIDGKKITLPVGLEVFDFILPTSLTFEPVFWADAVGKSSQSGIISAQRGRLYDRHNPDGAVLTLAKILAEHHGTAFYSHHDKSPYPVVWHWDKKAETAEFDFSWLDRNAKIMLEDYGQKYLSFGGKFRPAGQRTGAIWDWDRDVKKAMTYDGEMALPGTKASLETAEGRNMYRAYCQGLAKHLKGKGWLDCSYIYVCDETDPGMPSEIVKWCAETAHEVGLKTFAASYAWDWPVYMSEIDAFTGIVSPQSLDRIKKEGNQWWGVYNRPCSIHLPLANTRLVGPDSWFRGVQHYCTYFHWMRDNWVDPRDMGQVGTNAGYNYGSFLSYMGHEETWGNWVYPYPAWEPDDGPDTPIYVSSLRFEALRQSAEDYEYLKLLAEVDKTQRNDAHGGRTARDLIEQMKKLVYGGATNDRTMHAKDVFYVLEGTEYYELRRRIGREISKSGR
ncbi:MAG: glycoside hydrolase domain-containing protein [Planctomycetota bacterium]